MKKNGNGELKIEKGIPIPARKGGNSKGYAAALRKLDVGDSVVLPVTITTASNTAAHLFGSGKYTARKVDGGTRVWRIA